MNASEEIRALNSATDLIENIVNYSVCMLPDDKKEIAKTILPKDNISKKYFFILYLELFTGVNREMIPSKENGDSLIDILNKISCTPILNKNIQDAIALQNATNEFNSWINTEFEYEIYSANIQQNIKIKLLRKDALYLIGNKSKHTLSRSNSIVNKLVKIYKSSGVILEPNNEILLLEDIDTWLLDDFGGYHFTMLCELCSNIYHAIHKYITPVIIHRVKKVDDLRYKTKLPEYLVKDDEIFEFHELLGRYMRPWLPEIQTWDALLEKY